MKLADFPDIRLLSVEDQKALYRDLHDLIFAADEPRPLSEAELDELDRRVSRLEREPAESDGTLEDELDQVSLYGRLLERRRLRERADEERQLQSAVVLFIAAALVGLVALTLFS